MSVLESKRERCSQLVIEFSLDDGAMGRVGKHIFMESGRIVSFRRWTSELPNRQFTPRHCTTKSSLFA